MDKEIKFSKMPKSCEGLYRRMQNRCGICGQYIATGEEFGHIVINGLEIDGKEFREYLDTPYKDSSNRFIHEKCWNELSGSYFEKLINIYNKKWKRPTGKQIDLIDKKEIEIFKEKIKLKGAIIKKETEKSIKFKYYGYTYTLDKITKYVSNNCRSKCALTSLCANISFSELID